mmetsp:Transcript_34788/g.68352  ORF Transcript_34788/g.68352 Transcript_34788/m.68352 type:complete len:114 (-) Transcript_34788:1655-1996(-)
MVQTKARRARIEEKKTLEAKKQENAKKKQTFARLQKEKDLADLAASLPRITGRQISFLTDNDCPTFESMHLHEALILAIKNMGFTSPTPVQRACVPLGVEGQDHVAAAITGSG